MRLIIKKLFGKYDYDLNFDNKLNILIGENGCGKSTILKIIKYLSNLDFYSLSKIKFEEITLIKNEFKYTVESSLIKQLDVVRQYDFRRRFYLFVNKFYIFNDNFNRELEINDYINFITQMEEELGKDIISINCNDFDNVKDFLKKDLIVFGFTSSSFINSVCNDYIRAYNFPYGSVGYFWFIINFIYTYKKRNNNVKILSLAGWNDRLKEILRIGAEQIYDFTFFSNEKFEKKLNTEEELEKIIKLLKDNKRENISEIGEFHNYFNNYEDEHKVEYILNKILCNENNIFLYTIYRSHAKIRAKYKQEYEFLVDLLNSFKEYFKNIEDGEYGMGSDVFNTKNYDVNVIFEYILNNFNKIKKSLFTNDKLMKFENVISKYILTKKIEFDENLNITIIDKVSGNPISFKLLSSGEKKIINIFSIIFFRKESYLSMFYDDEILLFDEPELSLSIYWQEMLLNDIIQHCDAKVIIATQSPNLMTEETLKYLIEVKR